MAIRSPIVSVLGHVDHGKSSILDSIRGSNIVKGEAGAITQAIGASIMPLEIIKKRCGALMETLKMTINIPGILFIDTPGHAAFTSLRKRGGNLADIAIVVIDINEGFRPQTIEAIEILKNSKTPFIIAANKIDIISGYVKKGSNFLTSFKEQNQNIQQVIENKIYELVGSIYENFKLESERYDRVSDYTKQIAIVPCSAKEQIGLEEILMVITGLAQKYLEQNLKLNTAGKGKGIILEVKEDKGLGRTIDVILYDGTLRTGEEIIVGTLDEPIKARIRALLMPEPLVDMRDKKSKFKVIKEVVAATGIKISSPDFTENVIAGMPISGFENEEEVRENIRSQIHEITFDTEKKGIIVKADTIGSLEAIIKLLKESNLNIRKANLGKITKKDISDAESNYETDPLTCAILGFNIPEEKSTERVKIIVKDVIYALLDDYKEWKEEQMKIIESKQLENLTKPAKIEVLKNCIFRQSNPCICGIEILEGSIKSGTFFMNKAGDRIGEIKGMQSENKAINNVERGRQVAASLPGVTGGRQINEGDILYSEISEDDFKKIKKLTKYLSKPEIDLLKEIAGIKRKNNPVWGV